MEVRILIFINCIGVYMTCIFVIQTTRTIAFKLAKNDFIDILHKGKVINVEHVSDIKGPIRLRMNDNTLLYHQ